MSEAAGHRKTPMPYCAWLQCTLHMAMEDPPQVLRGAPTCSALCVFNRQDEQLDVQTVGWQKVYIKSIKIRAFLLVFLSK